MHVQHIRLARPVTNLKQSGDMYCHGLGLKQIASFSDHEGFSGVMLGADGLPCHIELTQCHAHPAVPAPSVEDLLVFYLPDPQEWALSCRKMAEAGFVEVEAFNEYWDVLGVTYEDHDGYRIVLQNTAWPVNAQ